MSRMLGGSQSLAPFPLLENVDALRVAEQKLIAANEVSAVILEGDSMLFGTGSSGIATSLQYLFRKKVCDIKNAHFGGSAKSGAGRFAPFFPAGVHSDVDGPIIIPTGSGWFKSQSGSVVPPANPYWTEMVRVALRHPGSITPAVGTHYAGCYMLFNPTAPHPGVAKWLGLLFNGLLAGTFRVVGWQGSTITAAVAGASGSNRYKFTAGAFGGSDVPDPSGSTDKVFDVTIDPANYPDIVGAITGHLNSAAMDPTAVWALCIYRLTNAATACEINAFDAHYDEYTAQNTPRSDGATTVNSFAWPGDTDQGEQDGVSQYGTNSDYWQQSVPFAHMAVHGRTPIHPKWNHTMPKTVLAIFNEWRNTLNAVDNSPANITPTQFAARLLKKVQLYGQAGICSLFLSDFGASSSYICSDAYFGTENTTYNSDHYDVEASSVVVQAKAFKGLQHLAGGLTKLNLDLAFGVGGPKSYAKHSMFFVADCLHWNDAGQERVAKLLSEVVCGRFDIGKAKPGRAIERTRDTRTLSARAGLSAQTVLSVDPEDYGALKMGGAGFMPVADNQVFQGPGFSNGVDLVTMTNTIRGSEDKKLLAYGFGERASLYVPNITNKNNRIVLTLPSISLTQFTLVFAIQNLWEGGIGAFPNSRGSFLHFGNATDDGQTFTHIYDAWSTGSLQLFSGAGFSGDPRILFGNGTANTNIQVGDHPNPGTVPAHDPYIGIISVNCTTKAVTSFINPSQAEKTATLHAAFPAAFAPTRLAIGGSLGTGAWCLEQNFGGCWLISGTLTTAEKTLVWNELQASSGNFFQMGSDFSNYGSMKTPV